MTADLAARLQAALGDAYLIERELGGGGMSRVFVAQDRTLARRVVVKVLPPEMAAAVNIERFRREIQLAASLQHPHIVPVLSAGNASDGADDDLLYYTMPFVEGETLRGLLSRHRELAVPEALRLLREIADALAYAHDRGVVHRDIKPENILLTTGHALVADFGIARALSAATGATSLTSVGVAVGTPAYMAPEQAAADPLTDHRADLYALGVVAYELLAGHPPFHGLAPHQMLAAHAMTQPDHVATRRPTVPAALGALIMQLLEKRPADRLQSAHDVVAALDAIGSQPTLIPGSGATPTAATGARGGDRRVAIALGAGVLVLAAVVAALALRRPAAPPPVDGDLIAVAPFRVTGDPSLAYLREGMLDLLAARLTGEGGPRAGDPRTLLSGWRRKAGSGDIDLPERDALDLARELGARQLLLGSVIATPQRITLHANLLTVPSGSIAATASAEGPADSLGALADRLAADLLARNARVVERLSGTAARSSLPVLRAYLDGMAHARRGRFPEAQRSMGRALELDSTFVPAALALVNMQGYHPIDASRPWELVMRVHARLNEHDRALIEARRRFLAGASYQHIREASSHYLTIAPDRAEAWVDLADDYFHFGGLTGLPDFRERARAAYTKAAELDPDFTPAIRGLILVATELRDTAAVRALWSRYQQQASNSLELGLIRWRVSHALSDSAALRTFRASVTELPPRDLLRILESMMVTGVGLEDAPMVLRELGTRAVDQYDVERGGLAAGSFLSNGGRDEDVPIRFRTSEPLLLKQLWALGDAIGWEGDTNAAAEGVRGLTAYALGANDRDDFPRFNAACALSLWHLWRRDTTAAMPMDRRTRELLSIMPADQRLERDDMCIATPDAMREHIRGDTSGVALARLDSLLNKGFEGAQFDNLTAARLHEARGDLRAALVAVRRRSNHGRDGPIMLTTMLREEGRLATRAGDVDGAIRAYRHFLALRPNPSSRLRADTERIRAELAALEKQRR